MAAPLPIAQSPSPQLVAARQASAQWNLANRLTHFAERAVHYSQRGGIAERLPDDVLSADLLELLDDLANIERQARELLAVVDRDLIWEVGDA